MTGQLAPAVPPGMIHRTIELLRSALERLEARTTLMDVERLAVMINRAMTVKSRSFHTPEHVFDLTDAENPCTTLAALFHDLVYFQVDEGFIPEIAATIASSISAQDGRLSLRATVDDGDEPLVFCMGVFGFEPGQELPPFGGMNEFLSALVMNRKLAGSVRPADLLLTTACIEATIPFRKADDRGVMPAERLAKRIQATNSNRHLGLSDKRIVQAVQWAVTFANRDVENFSEEDPGRFLDNTWKLLPETNPALRTHGFRSLASYRAALQTMERFLHSLDPETIYARYRGVPREDVFRGMASRATRNVETAREYLGIKLLTAAVIEALAEISGGDAPVSLFMGDLGIRTPGSRLEDYLPVKRAEPGLPLDRVLHDLLACGRASASSFDLQNSPLSLFIYLHLGTDGCHRYLTLAGRMFEGALKARVFLEALPDDMIAAIARAAASMVFTRADALAAFAASRGDGNFSVGRATAP